MKLSSSFLSRILQTISLAGFSAAAAISSTVVVSVPEQKLYVFDDAGEKVTSYPVSTSAHGLGDGRGTYSTPLGKLEIASKIGAGAKAGAVFKAARLTGEICKVNAPGRDPIVTRILHLRGLEKHNASAYDRRIYIHGTPDERRIGKPVSYGCVRMRSRDVVDLFDRVTAGTSVEIVDEKVSKGLFAKTTWNVPPPAVATGPASKKEAQPAAATAKVTNAGQQKIGVASKVGDAGKTAAAAGNSKEVGGAMTLFEMPGTAFKFGPGSRDEVR